jgi:long-chain acyl-CoA synthetase
VGAVIVAGDARLEEPELSARVARVASGLAALGVGDGDSVALMLRNDLAFFEISLAAGVLGAYPVPVNWHFHGEEAGYIVQDSGAKAVFAHADLLPRLAGQVPAGVATLVVETPADVALAYGVSAGDARVPAGATDYARWRDAQALWDRPARSAPASMIYTSGTTGRPKGVRRQPPTPEQVAATWVSRKHVFGFSPDMRAVMTGPLYHSAPNLYGMFTVRIGGTLHLQPRFDAEDLLMRIERDRLTHMHLVPTMFVRLLKLPDAVKRRYDLSSLQWVIHGAAPCPPDVKRAMIDWWGPVIHEYYGGTESGALVHCTSEEWLAHPGTVGRPIPGARVRAHDEAMNVCAAGVPGELYMRLGSVPDFTYHGQDAKRRAIDAGDGLISLGDVGYFDADGFLYLSGRSTDMVISGGVNIYPAEIEAVLHGLAGVRDCAVFGIPDEEFGEALATAIEAEPGSGLDAEAVRAHVARHLARYKVPKIVTFEERLPREDSGKIFKRKLRAPYWEKQGS